MTKIWLPLIVFFVYPGFAIAQVEGIGIIRSHIATLETIVESGWTPVAGEYDDDREPENSGYTSFSGYNVLFADDADLQYGNDYASGFVFMFSDASVANVDPQAPDAQIIDTPAESTMYSYYQFETTTACWYNGEWPPHQVRSDANIRDHMTKFLYARQNLRIKWKVTFEFTVPDETHMQPFFVDLGITTDDGQCTAKYDAWDNRWVVSGTVKDSSGDDQTIYYAFDNASPGDELTFWFYCYDFLDGQQTTTVKTTINDTPNFINQGQRQVSFLGDNEVNNINSGSVELKYLQAIPTG